MPAGNGTGPMGAGPMTGRAAGFCTGHAAPGYANSFGGRGFRGRGGGRGRGFRHWYHATGLPAWARDPYGYSAPVAPMPVQPSPEQELAALKQQAEQMQNVIEDVNHRIKELETQKTNDR